jgi:CHAD domain-containing protein
MVFVTGVSGLRHGAVRIGRYSGRFTPVYAVLKPKPGCYNRIAMGYRLEADESVPKGLRRIVREEIESSAEYLAGKKPGGPDEAIHEARKSIKKIRAVLRLVQPELGAIYDKENSRLGAIAADLSEIRDAAAILETFDTLPGAEEFGPVRRALVERKKQTDAAKDRDAVIQEAALGLRKLDKRVKTWPLKTGGFAALAPGLELRYRRGRRAMKAADDEQTPECFHEWRKRVKDHWYHTRLIESLWTDEMQAREKSLKELETWLGDDHNLFVMRGLIAGEPAAFGEAAMVEKLLDAIDKRQSELRRNALSLGARLYDDKPKAFARRIEHLWKEWQSRPRDLEKREADAGAGERSPRKPAGKAGRSSRGPAQVA